MKEAVNDSQVNICVSPSPETWGVLHHHLIEFGSRQNLLDNMVTLFCYLQLQKACCLYIKDTFISADLTLYLRTW